MTIPTATWLCFIGIALLLGVGIGGVIEAIAQRRRRRVVRTWDAECRCWSRFADGDTGSVPQKPSWPTLNFACEWTDVVRCGVCGKRKTRPIAEMRGFLKKWRSGPTIFRVCADTPRKALRLQGIPQVGKKHTNGLVPLTVQATEVGLGLFDVEVTWAPQPPPSRGPQCAAPVSTLTEAAIQLCRHVGVPLTPDNIVIALDDLGALSTQRIAG